MRAIIFITFLAFCGLANANVVTRLVNLRVDQFNPLDRRTFDCRYFMNNEHYLPGGPLFIHITGGANLFDTFVTSGAVYEIAAETRGHIFQLEHRFFGESRPTEDASVENLQFLTIHQALADIAQFISFIKANYYGAGNSGVILWGRTYGAALAVWARQKYPHLVDGVWASSAPIDAVLEYPQLMRNAFYTINSIGGPECGNVITGAMRMVEDAIRARNTTEVERRLRFCSPIDIDIEENIARIFAGFAAEIAYVFVSNARYPEIDEKCTVMRALDDPENPPENDLEGFARWFIDDFHRDTPCLDYNTGVLPEFDSRRLSFWLRCTQLGQSGTANEGEGHPFGWRFDFNYFRNWCIRDFGEELFLESQGFMEESIPRTNQFFGGIRPNVYRVFLTHGEMDPQRHLGPSQDLNDHSPVVVMSLQSSSRDLGAPSDTDYVVLHETKARARELILQWLVDAAQELPPETTTDPDATTTELPPGPAYFV